MYGNGFRNVCYAVDINTGNFVVYHLVALFA